jgi:MFS family permease
MARIVTGLFGGVIGSVVLAIATDLFATTQRGRVMGIIQTAFDAGTACLARYKSSFMPRSVSRYRLLTGR